MKRVISLVQANKKRFIVGAILLCGIIIIMIIMFGRSGKMAVSAESSLKEILDTEDLSTAVYTYNSIVAVTDENTVKYHVAYKGTVKAGFSFDEIQVCETDKTISIVLPEIKINSVNVNTDMDYIFTKKKYDTEKTYAEAYNACCKDLEEKAKHNQTLLDTAHDNAIETLTALIKPWKESFDNGLTIDIQYNENTEGENET